MGSRLSADEGGYWLANLYADKTGALERVALARFDISGNLVSNRWLGSPQAAGTGQSASFGFDEQGRLIVIWKYDPVVIERYLPGGAVDTSFGNNGSVTIDLPGSGGGQVIAEISRPGVVVLSAAHDQAYLVSANDGQIQGPFANTMLPAHNPDPFGERDPYAVTEDGKLFVLTASGIAKIGLDMEPITGWAANGVYPRDPVPPDPNSDDLWHYSWDTGELTVSDPTSTSNAVYIAADGQSAHVVATAYSAFLNIARFANGATVGMSKFSSIVYELDSTQKVIDEPTNPGGVLEVNGQTIAAFTLASPRTANERIIVHLLTAPANQSEPDAGNLSDEILRLYDAYFLRSPDQAGLDYWRSQRADGTSLDAVSSSFASSPEFQDLYGSLTDSQFVDLVYQNVLGRPADTAGQEFWVAQLLSGLRRGAMMTQFSESAENITRTQTSSQFANPSEGALRRLYEAYFLRPADNEGLCHWASLMGTGLTLEEVSASFASSPEFQSRYGSLTDAQFVDLVYQNVLNRSPDAAGRQAWLDSLASGLQRGTMMTRFSESPENILRTDYTP